MNTDDGGGGLTTITDPEAIIVFDESLTTGDNYDIIQSNIDFINDMLGMLYRQDEVSYQAMLSYWVDYYLTQMNNGGFSQFVHNSGWPSFGIQCVRNGLQAIGAAKHSQLFEKGAALVATLTPERLQAFSQADIDTYVASPELPILDFITDDFFRINEEEDLIELNSAWLKGHPALVIASGEQIDAEIERRADCVPDQDARIAMRAKARRDHKIILALCAEANQKLETVTAGVSQEFNGARRTAWHFVTDQGHFYMIDEGDKAFMVRDRFNNIVCEIDVSKL